MDLAVSCFDKLSMRFVFGASNEFLILSLSKDEGCAVLFAGFTAAREHQLFDGVEILAG